MPTADQFAKSVQKILDKYGEDVSKNVKEITKAYTKLGARMVKSNSQQFGGRYAGSWTSQMEEGRLSTTGTIYSKKPGLPHLLEFGHVSRNGTGRTFGMVKAYPHIASVEQQIVDNYVREVEQKL
jgi:hypothetical protein